MVSSATWRSSSSEPGSRMLPSACPVNAVRAKSGAVSVDPSVTIPEGATSATFTLTGVQAGVDEISAQPDDSRYDAAVSRIQVLASPDAAELVVESMDAQQVTFRIRDVNNLPYPGVRVQASVEGATPVTATSNDYGRVSFKRSAGQTLAAQVDGATSAPVVVNDPSR